MPSWTGSFGLAPPLLLGAQLVVAEQLQRLLGRLLVVAAVVLEAGDRGERELLGLDPVLAAQLERVHAQLDGELVHDPLDGERRLGPAGAAVGVGGHLVGEDAVALEPVGRELVDAREHERAQDRDARGDQPQVGAHVGEQPDLEALDVALAVGGDVDVLDLVAAVVGGHQRLAAGLGPLDRLAEPAGHQEREHLLRGDLQLAAEAAADVGGDDPQLVLGDAGDHRQHHPQDVRDLGRRPHREVVALRLDDDRARLHERRDQPLLDEPPADDDLGVGERLRRCPRRCRPHRRRRRSGSWCWSRCGRGTRSAPSLTASSMSSTTGSGVVVDVDELDGVLRGGLGCARR